MKIGITYNNFDRNIVGFIEFGSKIERVYLKQVGSGGEEGGEIDITKNKIRAGYANQAQCDFCSPNYYTDFLVDGIPLLDRFDIDILESDMFFNRLFNSIKAQILDKVMAIKSLFRFADENTQVSFSYDEQLGHIMRFEYEKVSGKFVIPVYSENDPLSSQSTFGVNDVLFLYNDGKTNAKYYAFSNYVVELRYHDDENKDIYMYFSGGKKANPVKELNEYLYKHMGEKLDRKDLVIYLINTFLHSHSPVSYIEEIINETFKEFELKHLRNSSYLT